MRKMYVFQLSGVGFCNVACVDLNCLHAERTDVQSDKPSQLQARVARRPLNAQRWTGRVAQYSQMIAQYSQTNAQSFNTVSAMH